jgi:hypothetical protein
VHGRSIVAARLRQAFGDHGLPISIVSVKPTSHRRRWIVLLTLAAMTAVLLGAWAIDAIRNLTAVNGIGDRRYVDEWLVKQQAALRSGDQSYVYFYDTRDTDALLQQFAHNPAIESLTFELTDLSDGGVKTIAELPNIKRLTLYGGRPRVGDPGLALLRGHPTLTTLKLINIDVTDCGLAVLQTLPRLRHLTLYRDDFREKLLTDGAVDELRNLTALAKLNIVGGWMSPTTIDDLRVLLPDCDIVVDANRMRDDEQNDARERPSSSDLN